MDREIDLLGAVLAGGQMADLRVEASDFAEPMHAAVWQACRQVWDDGHQPDPNRVREALGDRAAKLPGGPVWLVDLANGGIGANAQPYAAQVIDHADRRRLADLGARIGQYADIDAPTAELLERARADLDNIRARRDVAGTVMLGDVLPGVINALDEGVPPGLSTPWPDMDRLLHGLQPGRLYVVAARPGVGKSLMGQGLAAHWAIKHKLASYFVSLEMPRHELVGRFVACQANVDLRRMESGDLDDEAWDKLRHATVTLGQAEVAICDTPRQSLGQIRSGIRDLTRRANVGLVIVDYLQLIDPTDRRVPREQQVAEFSRVLKQIAKEFEVPVVALAQLNRGPEQRSDKKPMLSDVRESGAIESDADVVILLHRPPDREWELICTIGKNRSGPQGEFTLQVAGHVAQLRNSTLPALGAA